MKNPIQIWIGRKCIEEAKLKIIILDLSKLSFRKISIFPKLIKIKSILPRITHIFYIIYINCYK